MNKIILTQGIQGSGKTTWAKAWVAEDPEHRIRINNDDITSMWGQPFGTPGLYERLRMFRQLMITRAIQDNLDIVVDNMNLSTSSLKEVQEIVKNFDYVIEYKDFTKVPLEVCIERDSKRPNPIGEKIIRETYNKYIKNNG
jgi:tRNA uridine 5-carbamoylmethylation protein Kti12